MRQVQHQGCSETVLELVCGNVQKTDEAVARRVLKYMHVDSWECGSQNWSDNFAAEFKNAVDMI